MIIEMEKYNNWSNLDDTDSNRIFKCCYAFPERIVGVDNSRDFSIIDDTSCTNYYVKPLFAIIIEDEKARSQLLSFSIIDSRVKFYFIHYFCAVKEKVRNIGLFVFDRNITQIQSVKRCDQINFTSIAQYI